MAPDWRRLITPGSMRGDLSVTFMGQFVRRGLGFLSFVVLTRALGVEAFALYSLAFLAFEIALQFSDLGLTVGTTRFASRMMREGKTEETARLFRRFFLIKIVTGLAVSAVGYLIAPFLAQRVMERPELTPYLRVAFVGVIGMHLYRFYETWLQSRLEFVRNAVFVLIMPAAILVSMVAFWAMDTLDALRAQGIYALAPLAATVVAIFVVPHDFLRARGGAGREMGELFRFGRWIWITEVVTTLRLRINAVYLARMATLGQVSFYSYGDKLSAFLTLITGTLQTVYVPRVARLVTRTELKSVLRRTYRMLLLMIPALLLVPFAARPLIGLLQPDYVDAAPIFAVLFVSVLFNIAVHPAVTVLYSLNLPRVETIVQSGSLMLTVVLGYVLVRDHGAMGGAVAMLIQRGLSAIVMIAYVYHVVYRKEGLPEA